ncbi:MAG: hypothetical protein CMJ49_07340 [Planctomycetaceae bacterium]|nr:hypothetical protein [Planctomycetaceae bacterium]
MKAAVLHQIGHPFIIEHVPRPTIEPHEVLIETRTCGICRTDIHMQDGIAYVPDLPHIPGHEPAGVVARIGANVTNLAVGDRVVPHLFITEGDELIADPRHAPSATVKSIIGASLPGGFAEFFKAPAANLLKLPGNIPFEHAGLVSCAVITAVHACHRSRAAAGETAIVIGIGGIGIVEIQILKARGCRVIAIGLTPEDLDLATGAGADLAVTAQQPDDVSSFTAHAGADLAFDFVGIAATMHTCIDALRIRGRLIIVGEEDESPPINTIQLAQRELEIIGSRNGGIDDAREAIQLMADGVVIPRIDRVMPLDQFNQAMDHVRSGNAKGRVVIRVADD